MYKKLISLHIKEKRKKGIKYLNLFHTFSFDFLKNTYVKLQNVPGKQLLLCLIDPVEQWQSSVPFLSWLGIQTPEFGVPVHCPPTQHASSRVNLPEIKITDKKK